LTTWPVGGALELETVGLPRAVLVASPLSISSHAQGTWADHHPGRGTQALPVRFPALRYRLGGGVEFAHPGEVHSSSEASSRPRAPTTAAMTEHLQAAPQLRDYLRVLGRRKWIMLMPLIVVPLLAVYLSTREQPLYQASAEVLLNRQDIGASLTNIEDPTLLDPNRNAQTQAQLARVPAVAQRVVEALGLQDRGPYDFVGQSFVSASEETDLLTFSVVDANPELASRLATEYGRQFTLYRSELDTRTLRTALAAVDAQLNALKSEGNEGSALYADLADKQQQLRTLETLYTSRAVLVRHAAGAAQIQPKPLRNGIIGAMLGVVLALVFAFLAEALDTRVRSGDDIGEKLGLPLLARVPELPRGLRKHNQLVMVEAPNEPHAEAFRMLRTNLDFVNLEVKARALLVTSAVTGEGKSTVAANLAISLARTGRRVLLADFDVRAPVLESFFEVAGRPGLTSVALGEVELDEAITAIAVGDTSDSGGEIPAPTVGAPTNGGQPEDPAAIVEVLTTGPVPPNPGEFLTSRRVVGILEQLRARCDVLIIDAAPLLVASETLALMGQLDAFLLVARPNLLRSSMLTELQRILHTCPIPALGYVLTGAGMEPGRPPHSRYVASTGSPETLTSQPEKKRSDVRSWISHRVGQAHERLAGSRRHA
jgi:tyrosine-protein kinase